MAYTAGYSSGIPAGSTAAGSLLSSTGFDRLVLLHYGTVSANTAVLYKVGAGAINVPFTTSLNLFANDVRDLGPYFCGSSEALYGGATTSSGWLQVDEMRA